MLILKEEDILKYNLEKELKISFQAIFSLKEEKIVSYEVFSKFDGENFNDLSTEEIIKKLENLDIVHILDFIVLEKIERYLTEKNISLCINISSKTIVKEEFLERIERLKEGVKNLQIEITERGRFSYTDFIHKIIRLNKMGIKVVMDDFPIASSNLENLLKTHIDGVKLDRELIKYMGNDKGKRIYKKVVDLLKAIGNEITAEGVETEDELNFVKEAGVDLVQGYFIHRPITEEEFIKKLKQKKECV